MLVFDRGLMLGSCAGEVLGWPIVVFGIGLILAGGARLAIRRLALAGLWILPWLFLGVGGAASLIAVAALVSEPVTARVEQTAETVTVASCRGPKRVDASYAPADLGGRFVLQEKAKGPATPLVRLFAGGEQVAQIWLGHPGLNLDALARIAPRVVADYRRWQAR